MGSTKRPPLVCFSHLRWDFVWQRPQHLMSRFARDRQVFFIEEPIFELLEDAPPPDEAELEVRQVGDVVVAAPICLDPGLGNGVQLERMYARLLGDLVRKEGHAGYTVWFYSPMFLPALDAAPGRWVDRPL